ncbi:phosphoglucosamine mutase [Candidatus Methylacidithermus pantelleriae]|uniref:Phosphoglucosamine mutase n=1 Tax=Candidatus Methylacidithermus pantelleriae TaxID=2744239 RepID=A0A8J2BQ99_9BACT|nr:phosphoglucosamine mutase [Candidatus Methylacidithermus pantelleriae]CAF0698752.1 phosphoglucosamine mutase [Candidatus Methylacidithermus pantelleriae]
MPFVMQALPLFGTDGIRGVANRPPMTPELLLRLGRVLSQQVGQAKRRARMLVGRDTRISGPLLEAAFVAGALSAGSEVMLAGILPTPAIAMLTRELGFDAGIVVSASHNPYPDNGVKVFLADGFKGDRAFEQTIESLLEQSDSEEDRPVGSSVGRVTLLPQAQELYLSLLKRVWPKNRNLRGLRIVVDCANGATYQTTPRLLEELGAEVYAFHREPNGVNINFHCGSEHPQGLCEAVLACEAHLGVAHDGDGDRLLLCDETGSLLDGDDVLAIVGRFYLEKGKLAQNTLVATVMSNLGLDECLAQAGGRVVRTPVGDQHVVAAMRNGGFNVGGESSGHFIFLDYATTGDGLLSSLLLLQIMLETGQPLGQLRRCLHKYPQVVRNFPVSAKPPLEEIPGLSQALEGARRELGSEGRVLLRYSGTEPKLRLLVEAKDEIKLHNVEKALTQFLSSALGPLGH